MKNVLLRIEERGASIIGPSLTLQDAGLIHSEIHGTLETRIQALYLRKKTGPRLLAAQKQKIKDMNERIGHYRMFRRGGASKLVQLMSNQQMSGPEDVNKDIRTLM